MANDREHAKSILKFSKNILLIDWPNANIPRLLVEKGYSVFCHSPAGYTHVEISSQPGSGNNARAESADPGQNGYLVFTAVNTPSDGIDIVNIFRPEQEHADIIAKIAVPLKAKVIWLQPPVTSNKTEKLAASLGFKFVEGFNVADLAAE